MADTDAFTTVRDGIQAYGGAQQSAGEWHMVCCPFHDDSTPSLGIFLQMGRPRKFGSFHCLGCGKHGSWNEFAEKVGVPTIEEWSTKIEDVSHYAVLLEDADELVELSAEKVFLKMGCEEAHAWPRQLDWRGFSGEFIRSIGGYVIEDRFNDNVAALFLITIRGTVRGGVKAVYEKKEGGKGRRSSSYYTMRGRWIETYGLWPFDLAARMTKYYDKKFVVLVEGPRDALRLIRRGIPAVAVLGANTVTKKKAALIRSLGVDTIYAMPDNDAGGDKLWQALKKHLNGDNLRRLRLPRERDDNNKIIKMDPGNMPAEIMRNVVNLLERRHEVEVARFSPGLFDAKR